MTIVWNLFSFVNRITACDPGPTKYDAGGRVRVRVNVKEMGVRDRLADLELIIWGENLHAPLIERVVELPMDIYGGVWGIPCL